MESFTLAAKSPPCQRRVKHREGVSNNFRQGSRLKEFRFMGEGAEGS